MKIWGLSFSRQKKICSSLSRLERRVATFYDLPGIPLTCAQPPSGMVGWWPGDGNANDIIGGNNGGGATFAPGMVGRAFSFNGTDASVSIPDSTVLELGASDFTIDFWLRTTQTGGADGTLLWKTSCSGPCTGWQVWKRSDLNGVDMQVCDQVTGCQQWGARTAVNDGQWHLIAFMRSGTTLNAYLDGQNDTTVITDPAAADPTNGLPLLFGTSTSPVSPFNGLIDEVEIFNRALSAAEIQAIYNAGHAGKCK